MAKSGGLPYGRPHPGTRRGSPIVLSIRDIRLLFALLSCVLGSALAAPTAGAAVVLNEVNCEATDWVELVNTSDTAADISGWLLTDDPLTSTRPDHRLLFPASSSISPHDDLVVERGASGFPFGISCGADTIRLADNTGSLVDEISVPELTSPVDTWGRYPNGTGPWVQTASTSGTPNEPSSTAGTPAVDAAAWMFDPHEVVEIDLELPQESIDALSTAPTEYQDGTFSLTTTGGTYGPLNVGVRLKGGFGSFRPLTQKAAFKVKLHHSVPGQRFLGLKTLTLNNMIQDPSMTHEVLAYEAFRSAGVAAPRTGYAYVQVNDQDYGVYLNVETLDDVSLPRWFATTQHLYEGAYGTDVVAGGAGAFEVDEGSETDRADLEALIAAVNQDGGDWSDRVSALADLQHLTRMWAVEKYIGHWDGYVGIVDALHPNNFYLHSDSAGRFRMLPWGTDQTWSSRLPFGEPGGLLLDECLADDSCFAMYRDAVRDVSSMIVGLDLDSRAQSIAAVLAPWQANDPRHGNSPGGIEAAVTATRAFLGVRPVDAEAWLAPPSSGSPPPLSPPPLSLPPLSLFPTSPPSPPGGPSTETIRLALIGDLNGAARRLRRLGIGGIRKRRAVRLEGVQAFNAGRVKITARTSAGRKARVARRAVVLRGERTFDSAGHGTLLLRLTGTGRRLLEHQRRTRRLALTLRGNFTDRAGGTIRTPGRAVTLRHK